MIKMIMNNYITKIKKILQDFLKDPLFLRRWEMSCYSRNRDDNQLSVRTRYSSGKLYHYNSDSNNFIQNIYNGIMPFSHMVGQREKYPVKIEPVSLQKEKIIASGISRSNQTLLADALYDFVGATSHSLFMHGIALFEVVYEKNTIGDITKFHFEYLDEKYLFRFFENYYQIIPWWIAKENNVRVQIVKIPAEKIFCIDFPKKLGGKRKLQRTLKRLWEISREGVPSFQMDAMRQNNNIGFNFEDYKKGRYLEIASLTSRFGWNQGKASTNYITEYYWFLRYLRQVKAQTLVREDVILRLNDFLNSSVLNLGVSLSIDNLPTLVKIEEQEKKMKEGNMKFMDIYNSLKI